jgi:hypothetical protein
LGYVGLHEALDLTALIAQQKPGKFGAAAVRLHGRLELEAAVLTLPESQLFLAALAQLGAGDTSVIELLRRLMRCASPSAVRRMS